VEVNDLKRRLYKKGVTDISGMHSMRTLQSTGKRSVPRGYQSSAFIDLYMLGKERERLEKEFGVMERRRSVIERRLKDRAKETEKLEAFETKRIAESGGAIRKSIPFMGGRTPGKLKYMEMHY
jgi:hypothetical protein